MSSLASIRLKPCIEKTCILSLGSNIAPRKKNLQQAIQLLKEKITLKKISSLYETSPVGNINQPNFYNLCILGKTHLTPAALLCFLTNVEKRQGQLGEKNGGPRVIDLDIIFYATIVMQTPSLIIPHPRYHKRLFVLKPLLEIASDIKDPLTGKKVCDYLTCHLKKTCHFAKHEIHLIGRLSR